jgi:hypothetical protein
MSEKGAFSTPLWLDASLGVATTAITHSAVNFGQQPADGDVTCDRDDALNVLCRRGGLARTTWVASCRHLSAICLKQDAIPVKVEECPLPDCKATHVQRISRINPHPFEGWAVGHR